MSSLIFSRPYSIGNNGFMVSLSNALQDFVKTTGTKPAVVCVFREDIPTEIVLHEKVLGRFGVVFIAGDSVKVLSGGWWQTFQPGSFAFLLSPQSLF